MKDNQVGNDWMILWLRLQPSKNFIALLNPHLRELCAKLEKATLTYTTSISFELSQNTCQHHGELAKMEFKEAKQVKPMWKGLKGSKVTSNNSFSGAYKIGSVWRQGRRQIKNFTMQAFVWRQRFMGNKQRLRRGGGQKLQILGRGLLFDGDEA